MKFLTIFLLLSSLMMGFIYYTLSSTSIPYDAIVHVLNGKEGILIEGVRGSLRTGIELDKVKLEDNETGARFYLKNFKASYDNFKAVGEKKVFLIKNISLDQLEIIGNESTETKSEVEYRDESSQSSGQEEGTENVELRVENISIKNVTLKKNRNSDGLKVDLFIIKNLVLNSDGLIVDEINLISSHLDMSGRSFVNSLGETQLDLAGLVKSQLIEGLLKDFSFKVRSTYKSKELKVKLTSFNDALLINLSNDKLGKIELKKLSLGELFKREFVLSDLNGEYTLPKLTELMKTEKSAFFTQGELSFKYQSTSYKLLNGSLKADTNESNVLSLEAKNNKQESILIKFGQNDISNEFVFRIEPKA